MDILSMTLNYICWCESIIIITLYTTSTYPLFLFFYILSHVAYLACLKFKNKYKTKNLNFLIVARLCRLSNIWRSQTCFFWINNLISFYLIVFILILYKRIRKCTEDKEKCMNFAVLCKYWNSFGKNQNRKYFFKISIV